MRIIINSSTFKGTGVTQVAVSFINECVNFPENVYMVFMSPNVASNITQKEFPDNFTFHIFGKHSLYGPLGIPDLLKMKHIEAIFKPDVVFSVFGPSLWKPKAPHLQGYAFPHYIYADSPAFEKMSLGEKIGVNLRRMIHLGHMKNEGEYFVCETDDVSKRLCEQYHILKDNVFTVSNTANSYFLNYKANSEHIGDDKVFKFYSLCSNSSHKNLAILNEVIPLLQTMNLGKRVEFYVTIPPADMKTLFKQEVLDSIVNVGPLKVADCPAFVDFCDALFLPTLLECFSASYPEAMLLEKPILTSDLSFARIVCGEAALYFNPLNARDIVSRIIEIVTSHETYKSLQMKGIKQVKKFLTPRQRAQAYLDICKKIGSH